ncbi:MAG: MaoC family dehydratase N-terminal domain-containing protein [Proteobacteria bacterium]|nr:MaoC family dehydratase N-terminal domain-containing protein [Pseudomonadota bacterium]MBI3498626.1 MaoC family dehydratase N-terminal domain-containing protein [Pseudomonadota bacterium]
MSVSSAPGAADLKSWIGRRAEVEDIAAAWPAAALSATLDREDAPPATGEALPPGWHWLYFLEAVRSSRLGEDGHAERGGFLPPVELPRRMWAGGRLIFHRPLCVGEAIRQESEILAIEEKEGRSGKLVFVTVRHVVTSEGALAVEEEHDIVYRGAPGTAERAKRSEPAPPEAAWQRRVVPDAVMLFRFSSLTFNAHRIHYDHPYVTQVEGYPGLVVHGPLQAILLLDLCRRLAPRPVRNFAFRALAPVFAGETLTLQGKPAEDGASAALWVAGEDGRQAMTAEARF